MIDNERRCPEPFEMLAALLDFRRIGWGTWIRTKINGVRVRCSTVELSPKAFAASRRMGAGARPPRVPDRRIFRRGLPFRASLPRCQVRCGCDSGARRLCLGKCPTRREPDLRLCRVIVRLIPHAQPVDMSGEHDLRRPLADTPCASR